MAKPIINLFFLEKNNNKYRNELDRLSRRKDIASFTTVCDLIVEFMEIQNPEALNNPDVEETGKHINTSINSI